MTTANPFAKSAPAADSFDTAESTKPAEVKASQVADPFASPSGPGSGEKITDYVGELLLVTPEELIENMETSIGTADAVRCNMAVLTGESAGHICEGILVFQTALRRDLIRILDSPNASMLLGRLGKGEAKKGKSAPYIFEQPTDEEKVTARQFLAAQ